GIVLMENAGRGTVDCMVREFGPAAGKLAPVFVGPGNNGGDGLVIARRLHELGGLPFIVYLVEPAALKGDAAVNREIVRRLDLPHRIVAAEKDLNDAAAEILRLNTFHPVLSLVDALFGTGLQRPLAGRFLSAVNLINRLRGEMNCPVTAVDIPSGLDTDTGMPLGGCVRADVTVTYGLAKPGHFMHGGGPAGRLHVVDIGIPRQAVDQAGLAGETLDPSILKRLSSRRTASHKGNYGHLLVLAGSTGKTGAAILSALGALRIGAGLVTLCVPADLNTVFESSLFEAMTVPLPNSVSCLSFGDLDLVRDLLQGKNAVVVGPGLGTAPQTRQLVQRLYREVELPMVVDADALNALALDPGSLTSPAAERLLTPHPGEMARLTGKKAGEIQQNRVAATIGFSAAVNGAAGRITLILKGAGTLICDPDRSWAVNTSGNPGMAAGGMGDVLSGLLGGLLAQGYPPAIAARLGVYLHGLAADRLAEKAPYGYTASEVAGILPEMIGTTPDDSLQSSMRSDP
ncbi:MAG TPA: NAD(P)H-hydrate dehydratase, partial [Desulfobacteraceae bacterium]|nr:NAD(P)H-hydrate dehydratase [Desulfobacteraceae bacterium]